MSDRFVYKIVSRPLWAEAEHTGIFRGAPVDHQDGFIHLSSATQVAETVRRHFANQQDLLLIAIPGSRLGAALKWEPSRGGDLFPHLYGDLPLDSVLWVKPLPLGDDGRHAFPELEDGI